MTKKKSEKQTLCKFCQNCTKYDPKNPSTWTCSAIREPNCVDGGYSPESKCRVVSQCHCPRYSEDKGLTKWVKLMDDLTALKERAYELFDSYDFDDNYGDNSNRGEMAAHIVYDMLGTLELLEDYPPWFYLKESQKPQPDRVNSATIIKQKKSWLRWLLE